MTCLFNHRDEMHPSDDEDENLKTSEKYGK